MGLILAGILVGVVWSKIIFRLSHDRNSSSLNDSDFLRSRIGAICWVILGLIGGITCAVSGYGEAQIESTTELVSLRNDTVSKGTGGLFYISISGNNSYTYYVEVDSTYASNSQKAYKSNTISDSDVTIVEDDNYTDAKLVTYVRYGKKSFWTFAVGAKKYEYIFYVPTGTIVRDVSLG
mgnify:FL=1